MEKLFLVKNDDLSEVNEWLQKGGRVKHISPVAECISAYGYSANAWSWDSGSMHDHDERKGSYVGDIFAYVVIEFD